MGAGWAEEENDMEEGAKARWANSGNGAALLPQAQHSPFSATAAGAPQTTPR